MFTIKLYQNPNKYTVICCPNYEVSRFPTDEGEVVEVTVYKDYTTQYGTIYRVAENMAVPHCKYAFIENVSGKTIDHIKCGS